jgi:heme/copper-type cytochrome/quinol oxidase subunit 2
VKSVPRLHLLVLLIVLLGLAVLLARGPLLMNDFVEYWAAARVVLSGGNPYDPAQILAVERSVGFSGSRPLLMLNPPPVLTLILPFAAVPYRQAALLWLILNAVALLWSLNLLWDLAGGSIRGRWAALAAGVFFLPSVAALVLGQITVLVLLGLALFLRFERHSRWAAAGAASTLLLIKPHIVYLVGLALVTWWIQTRNREFLRGACLAVLLSLVPLAFNPLLYGHYLEMLSTVSLRQFSTSTAGSMLRIATGDPSRFGLQFLPMVLGLAYLLARLRRRRGSEWNWEREMPALVTISVATAAYGWLFDYVVLLIAALPILVIAIHGGGVRLAYTVAFWLLITAVSYGQVLQSVNSFWYVWIPWAFLPFLPRLSRGPQGSGP